MVNHIFSLTTVACKHFMREVAPRLTIQKRCFYPSPTGLKIVKVEDFWEQRNIYFDYINDRGELRHAADAINKAFAFLACDKSAYNLHAYEILLEAEKLLKDDDPIELQEAITSGKNQILNDISSELKCCYAFKSVCHIDDFKDIFKP